ncbi:DNA mismatch repair endonuclease MutL [Reichenbachiella carrageenanivorans]|uniref:DNA mismatch repair protein MutL n=1 Tax=Reichenbachiella carrageenanivorans TaxID=2979869 RepID=A0ABY6CZW4_9BACT|nr:DNA mismatch repair endonuclease MutL [Reichenbachiella carrageenanivorans]UXX78358.1 DNA mismatch repair endonuclease MutL [Reichenbachiella carrageenanivorans]
MPDIINLLPDAIANQIAAGEVVQRPASVVKELLENSVDAGSTHIQLIINEAGKVLIHAIDNGLGMSETDARMCFERHATSKIATSEDLFKIKTMGFRGEALASIAAVARVELKSKTADAELATFIHIEASEIKKQEPISASQGTSIAVKNLFYNVPARRNFLKSNPVEMRHILDEFHRVALSNPAISFSFTQNEKEIYQLPAGKLSQRIVSLFGKNYQKQLITCQEETHWLKVQGYIGTPEFCKKTRGEQFFFINNRFIKSSYLNHAVQGAYEGMIQEGQFPFYALFIEMDPIHIDINVHPTKTEVKFDDERSVYGIIKAAVKQALGTHNVTPSLDFGSDVNFKNLAIDNSHFNTPSRSEGNYSSFKSLDKQGKSTRWDEMYEQAIDESRPTPAEIRREELAGMDTQLIFQSEANTQQSVNLEPEESSAKPTLMHDKYILKQVKKGVMVVDVVLAHERILYEKYLETLHKKFGASQRSLFPVTLEMNPADFSLVMELKEEISALGFEFEEFGKHTIAINGIPAEIKNINEKELFEGLLEQFKFNKSELSLSTQENMARSIAKRSASKTKISNDSIELRTLIDRLFACQQPNYTPNGTPTFIILGLEKIAEFFNQ